jgi:hypothetical protein
MKTIKHPISCQIVEHGSTMKLYYVDGKNGHEVVPGPIEYLLKIRLQGGETIKVKASEEAYQKSLSYPGVFEISLGKCKLAE